MPKHIALLRGINVGGKNKISMPVLKAAFEAADFADVRTYINSGNVIFSIDDEDTVPCSNGAGKSSWTHLGWISSLRLCPPRNTRIL